MLNAIKREWRLQWRSNLLLYGLFWCIFAVVVGGVVLIMELTNSETYAEMGCAMASMIAVIILLIRFVLWGPYYYTMALSMGRTRRYAMLTVAGHSGVLTALFAVTLRIFHLIENSLYATLYPLCTNEISFAELTTPGMLAAIAAVLWTLTFLLGGMIVRFGRKAWWVAWVLWMFGCLILPRIFDEDYHSSPLFRGLHGIFAAVGGALGAVTPVVWWALGIAVLIAAVAAAVRMYLRAEVRF